MLKQDQKEKEILSIVKKDQLDSVLEKEWGREECIVNNAKYCGKKVVLKKGYCVARHYHKTKEETFYVLYGKVMFEFGHDDKLSKRILTAGDIQHVIPGLRHKLTMLADSAFIEFSTFDEASDLYKTDGNNKFVQSVSLAEQESESFQEKENLFGIVKKDQLDTFVDKIWGHEEWIVNNDKYCGKKLVFKQGCHCSLHYHKLKEETFYLLYGKMLVELEQEDGSIKKRIITAGDVQHINIGLPHRMTALIDSAIIEFSTYHMDSDSYRKSPSGKIDLSTLKLG